MAEIVISIGAKVAEYMVDPILQGASYLFCFKQFNGDLEKAKEELKRRREEVKERKEQVARNNEEITLAVKHWLNQVENILEDVQKLQREVEGEGKSCFNVSLRYSLAKQMDNKAKQMIELKNNSHFDPFSCITQLPDVTYFASKDFVDFKSRKSTYNLLVEALKDKKNNMIGLYGMGGSGKTTLAKEVGKKAHDDLKLFEKVVMVVVSKPPNVVKIQQEIADLIGLRFPEEAQSARAQRLSEGLKNQKILIILDDVWEYLRLEEIGIPLNENCRVLLTTRHEDVCESMSCESKSKLSLLEKDEAWALFRKHASIANNESLNGVGSKIVDECKGLPIAIVTVGKALRGKGIVEWESALQRLQNSIPLEIDESSRGPYACLKLSYDNLPSLDKQLFLLCSMFPEDHEIHMEDLTRFGKGTLEFDDKEIVYTMEDARREMLVSIHRLLDSCLLMPTDNQACVKMHDLVRDVALWISKKHQHQEILVDGHAVSRMLDENESLIETKVMSLWNLEDNFELSNQLRSPTLEILLLHPEGFIEDLGGLQALKVLAFITFSFRWRNYMWALIRWSMPQSSVVPSLGNIHTICFRGIRLGDISFLCQLKRLEILDLHGSHFDKLPTGIVDMKKLKLLDVFECQTKKSSIEVIGRCEQLEELYICDDKSVIPENFSLSRLQRYAIYDSCYRYTVPFVEYFDACTKALRALCIKGFNVSTLNSSMKDLIVRSNYLWLGSCRWDKKDINLEIKHSLVVLDCGEKRFIIDNNLQVLQDLHIWRCPQLRAIFNHDTVTSLPKLRKLRIGGCNNLKWIFPYSLASHCPSLEELIIEDCPELERLIDEETTHGNPPLDATQDYRYGNENEKAFVVVTTKSSDHLRNQKLLTLFLSLKVVWIRDSMRRKKWILEVQIRGTNEEPLKLNSEIRSLSLSNLQGLEYIWKGPTQSVSLYRLKDVYLMGCPRLRSIFSLAIVTSLPELRKLYIQDCEEWEGRFCEEPLQNLSSSSSNVCFPKLESIIIEQCHKVRRLFSYSLASHCPSLQQITIEDCSQLEGVVLAYEGEEEDEAIHHQKLFPKLNDLRLEKLPKLREIYPDYEFNHLSNTIHIQDCPNICNIPLQS